MAAAGSEKLERAHPGSRQSRTGSGLMGPSKGRSLPWLRNIVGLFLKAEAGRGCRKPVLASGSLRPRGELLVQRDPEALGLDEAVGAGLVKPEGSAWNPLCPLPPPESQARAAAGPRQRLPGSLSLTQGSASCFWKEPESQCLSQLLNCAVVVQEQH